MSGNGRRQRVAPPQDVGVFVAHKHKMLCTFMASAIASSPGWRVVGQACDCVGVSRGVTGSRPAMVVMCGDLPNPGCADTVRLCLQSIPELKIVVMLDGTSRPVVHEVVKAGAKGIVLLDSPAEELLETMRKLKLARTAFPLAVTEMLAETWIEGEAAGRSSADGPRLSSREEQVFRLACKGHTTAQIADTLSLSRHTVGFHRKAIRQKICAGTREDIVAAALRQGLVPVAW